MSERATYTICCIGLRNTSSGKVMPFFIWQMPDGTWSPEGQAATWGRLQDVKPGVVYTIDGDQGADGKPGSVYPASLRYRETWRDREARTRWCATSATVQLQDRAVRQTRRLSEKAAELLGDLNRTYWGLPTNQRGAFLAWVMMEVTKP